MKNITNIRKAVVTLANRLNKKIKNLSNAFIRAWQIIKGKLLISKIAGVTFGTRQKALNKLQSYSKNEINVTLEREASNSYDTNAVKVMVSVGAGDKYHMGYIPADLANMLAPVLDKGIQLITRFKSVTGGYAHKENYGALIEIEI